MPCVEANFGFDRDVVINEEFQPEAEIRSPEILLSLDPLLGIEVVGFESLDPVKSGIGKTESDIGLESGF
jgi:hypothetical protein